MQTQTQTEEEEPEEYEEPNEKGIMQAGQEFAFSLAGLFLQVVAFFSFLGSLLGTVISSLPTWFFVLLISGLMYGAANYGDRVVEEAEFFMRCRVEPIYDDVVQEFLRILGLVYNNLVCWWDIFWGFPFLIYREVVFPLALDCGVRDVLRNAIDFVSAVFFDLVAYLVTGQFFNGPLDFTNIRDTFIVAWSTWQDLVCCTCGTLCKVLKTLPIFPTILAIAVPVPNVIPVLPFIAGDQLKDPETWCFISNALNAGFNLVQIVLDLVFELFVLVFTGNGNFTRPNLRPFVNLLCDALVCGVRSIENSLQNFWDCFAPFPFIFRDWLAGAHVAGCIILKFFGLLLEIIIHIDEAIFYPANPYWEDVVRKDFMELINLVGEPTKRDPIDAIRGENTATPTVEFTIRTYHLDTFSLITPEGDLNPVYQKMRLTDALCIFVTRTLCDPTNNSTACYDNTGFAQNLLEDFDFCCILYAAGAVLTDALAGLFEISLHLAKGPDEFFIYLDNDPFLAYLKDDLAQAAVCLSQIFTLIPVVGDALSKIIVAVVRWLLCMILFLVNYAVGLLTLPYFVIVLPGTPNFVTRTNEALDQFVTANDALIDRDNPMSLINSLCVFLNFGFPVPPIPCAKCNVVTLQGEPARRKERELFPHGRLLVSHNEKEKLFEPYSLLNDVFGYREEWDTTHAESAHLRMTPMRYYKKSEDGVSYSPYVLWHLIMQNVDKTSKTIPQLLDQADMRKYVDDQKKMIMERWQRSATCKNLKQEKIRLRREDKDQLIRNTVRGRYDPLKYGQCPVQGDSTNRAAKFTLFPTQSPLVGCGNQTAPAGDPSHPPCFDLCCFARTTLEFIVHALNLVARFGTGLIQGEDPLQKTVPTDPDYGYFVGTFCDNGRDCFESDVVTLVLRLVRPLKCLCEFINLIIPVSGTNGRSDLCCAIQRAGELVACTVQLLVNAINALAMGDQDDYAYYRDGSFQKDVSVLFEVTVAVVECLCTFVRGVFPGNFFSEFTDTIDFDPCCLIEALLLVAVALLQYLINIIVALATLAANSPTALCYWRIDLDLCQTVSFGDDFATPDGTISTIGFVQDGIRVIDELLPKRNQDCYQNCNGNDPGKGGIVPCVCQIINAFVPVRADPSRPVSCSANTTEQNCMFIDFCCPVVKTGMAARSLLIFTLESTASLWQSWEPGYPEYFTAYFFCDENSSDYALPPGIVLTAESNTTNLLSPVDQKGFFVCGKFEPIIDSLVGEEGLVSRCLCEYFQILDWLLSTFFEAILGEGGGAQWGNCFCGGRVNAAAGLFDGYSASDPEEAIITQNNSVLGAISYLIQRILIALVTLVRRLPDPTYWSPSKTQTLFTIEETWVYTFLGPIADAACLTLGNAICFLNSLFFLNPACLDEGKRFAGSTIRWLFEIVIRLIAFVEGFVSQFIDSPPCAASDPTCQEYGANQAYGVSSSQLGRAFVAIFGIPFDVLIGDGSLSCSGICTPRVLQGLGECACYNLARHWRATTEGTGETDDVVLRNWWQFNTMTGTCQAPSSPQPSVTDLDQPACDFADCVQRRICLPQELPVCGSHPDTPESVAGQLQDQYKPIDGILLGFIRYLRCLVGADAGVIFYPLEIIFSVAWQIVNPVLNFIAAILVFFFSIFTILRDFGAFIGSGVVLVRFIDIFIAFFNIFTTPIDVPPIRFHGPMQRTTMAEFKNMSFGSTTQSYTFEEYTMMLYDYDTTDCFADLNACVCRNLDVPELCTWNPETGVSPPGLSTSTTIQYVSDNVFGTGENTACSAIITHCTGMTWDNVLFAEKSQFVECLDKRIQGERFSHMLQIVPSDFFYSHRGLYNLVQNIVQVTRDAYGEERNVLDRYKQEEHRAFSVRFGNMKKELYTRRKTMEQKLRKELKDPRQMMMEPILRLDEIQHKYRMGYYNYMVDRALTNVKEKRFFRPPIGEATRNVMQSFIDIFQTLYNQPYTELIDAMIESNKATKRVFDEAFVQSNPVRYVKHLYHAKRRKYVQSPTGRAEAKKRAYFAEVIEKTPLVRFYRHMRSDEDSKVKQYLREMPITQHYKKIVDFQREHWAKYTPKENAWVQFKAGFWKRWAPRWTKEKLDNLEELQTFFYQTVEKVIPGFTPPHHQRFLFNQACRIVDDTLDLAERLVFYCAAHNINNVPRQEHNSTVSSSIRLVQDKFYAHKPHLRDTEKYVWEPMPLKKGVEGAHKFRRLRNQVRERKGYQTSRVDGRVYRRQVTFGPGSGPQNFNLYDWLFDTILVGFFGADMNQTFDQIVADVQAWFTNPNLDVGDFPDVGARYWLIFTFRCLYFENLDCGIGVGLEKALGDVLFYGAISVGVGYVAAPGLTGSLLPFVVPFAFGIVVPAYAWHYSPQCWFMTPTIPFFSIQVPIYPFPVAPPALPFCLWDEVTALLDKYIAKCYDFVIPLYMFIGDACPTCDQRVDIVNCKSDVGMADGLQNLLYAGHWLFGDTFRSFVLALSTTVVGRIVPSSEQYLEDVFMSFMNPNPTLEDRQRLCFWLFSPAIILPLGVIGLLFTVVGGLVFAFIQLGGKLVDVLGKSPLGAAVPGADNPWLSMPQDGSRKKKKKRRDPPLVELVSHSIERLFIRRKYKKE